MARTRVVPKSHKWPPINVAAVNRFDWVPGPLTPEEQALVPKDLAAPYPGEVLVEAPAGSIIVANSSIWHAGTRNISGKRRRVLHLTYTRRDLPQQLVQRQYFNAGDLRADEPGTQVPAGHRAIAGRRRDDAIGARARRDEGLVEIA